MTHKTSLLVPHSTNVREITVDRPETSIVFCGRQCDHGSVEALPSIVGRNGHEIRMLKHARNTPTHVNHR